MPYYTYKQYLLARYGKALYRVPVDPGFGCPNRGPDGSGGCTFCGADGARASQTLRAVSMTEQIEQAIAFARRRYHARGFMAYIQSFTGTFAPASAQRECFLAILRQFPFDALSVGTRPDCLPPATLDLLRELNAGTDVWVELGIQTVHDATLRAVRRGHDWAAGRRAIRQAKEAGLRVAAHVILGLPGETAGHFRETACALAAEPLDAIKIHNLHVVRGTALADQFARQPFSVYDETAYADILIDFLRRLPPDLPIMRVCTDTAAADLVAPRWACGKTAFIDRVRRRMRAEGVRQGDLAGEAAPAHARAKAERDRVTPTRSTASDPRR